MPSFYGLEVLRAAEGKLPGFDELARARRAQRVGARIGWPAPRRAAAHAIDEAEYDLALLEPILEQPENETRRRRRATSSAPTRTSRARCASARGAGRQGVDAAPTAWSIPIAEARGGARRARARRALVLADRAPELRRVPVPLLSRAPCTSSRRARSRWRSRSSTRCSAARWSTRCSSSCSQRCATPELAAGDAKQPRRARATCSTRCSTRWPSATRTSSRRRSSASGRTASRRSAPTCASGCGARPRTPAWTPAHFELSFGLAGAARPRSDERRRAGAARLRHPAARLDRSRRAAHDGRPPRHRLQDRQGAGERRHRHRRRRDAAAGALRARAREALPRARSRRRAASTTAPRPASSTRSSSRSTTRRARPRRTVATTRRARRSRAGFFPAAPAKDGCEWCDYRAGVRPVRGDRARSKQEARSTRAAHRS